MGQESDNRTLVESFWKEVYAARDYDRVGTFFAEDGLYEDVPTPDTGDVVPLPFVSVMRIAGGKIQLWRDYSDQATLMAGVPQWWLDHIGQFTAADFGSREE